MIRRLETIFTKKKRKRDNFLHHGMLGRRLRLEGLEDRRLLAITWANQFDPNNGFATEYLADESIARQLVNRAIDDWNRVVIDQNWDNDDDPLTTPNFVLTVNALELNGSRGATEEKKGSQLIFFDGVELREAVDLANMNDNTSEEIWLPAWSFVLTRERTGGVKLPTLTSPLATWTSPTS